MRLRMILMVPLTVVVGALLAPACSSGLPSDNVASAPTSTRAPRLSDYTQGDSGSSAGRSSSAGSASSGGGGTGSDPAAGDSAAGSDQTTTSSPQSQYVASTTTTTAVPSIDDLAGVVAASVGSCVELASQWAQLQIQLLGGTDPGVSEQQVAQTFKSQLPADLHNDVDIVAAAVGQIAVKGVLDGAGALNTPQYQAANGAVTSYLATACGG